MVGLVAAQAFVKLPPVEAGQLIADGLGFSV
jgi:hypothetical protein